MGTTQNEPDQDSSDDANSEKALNRRVSECYNKSGMKKTHGNGSANCSRRGSISMTTASEISPDEGYPAIRKFTELEASELDICSVDISMCSTRGPTSVFDQKIPATIPGPGTTTLSKAAPVFKPTATPYFKPEQPAKA